MVKSDRPISINNPTKHALHLVKRGQMSTSAGHSIKCKAFAIRNYSGISRNGENWYLRGGLADTSKQCQRDVQTSEFVFHKSFLVGFLTSMLNGFTV